MVCSKDHVPIQHDEFYCPLCVEQEDRRLEVDAAYDLEQRLEEFDHLFEEISAADTLQLLAQVERAGTVEHELTRAVNHAVYEIGRVLDRPGTKADIDKRLRELYSSLALAKTKVAEK